MNYGIERRPAARLTRIGPYLGLLVLCQLFPVVSVADTAVPPLVVEKHCIACHAMNDVLIGPPLIAIAARYSASASSERTLDVLAHKIMAGGAGNWGTLPMVPNDLITLDEARTLAKLVLSLKP